MLQANVALDDHASLLISDCTEALDSGFRFAYQPIIDRSNGSIAGYEALVRGLNGESAASVIAAIGPEKRQAFDQACRVRALQTAARLKLRGDLHLNCSRITPENLASAIDATRECALENGIDPGRVVLEFGELETLGNPRQLVNAHRVARDAGFRVLADNVGAGEVGLKRLAVFRPRYAKLDRSLVSGVDSSPRRQAIVQGVIATCDALGIEVIAAGIETEAEAAWLERAGVNLAQGYLFGAPSLRPGSEALKSSGRNVAAFAA